MKLKEVIVGCLLFFVIGCGTKKKLVERSKEKSIEIENKDLQRTQTNNITTNTIKKQYTVKTTVRPINESKPFKFNNNVYENAEIVTEKSEKKEYDSTIDKSVTILDDQSDYHNEQSSSTTNKDINIDRSWGVMDWLWMFLAILIVVVGVRLYIKKINPLKGLKNIIGIK